MFLTQIWFGECNQLLLKVKNLCKAFFTFNAYSLNSSKSESDYFYQKSLKRTNHLFEFVF